MSYNRSAKVVLGLLQKNTSSIFSSITTSYCFVGSTSSKPVSNGHRYLLQSAIARQFSQYNNPSSKQDNGVKKNTTSDGFSSTTTIITRFQNKIELVWSTVSRVLMWVAHMETVPYTRRIRIRSLMPNFMLRSIENVYGEGQCTPYKDFLLPKTDPLSVRVSSILEAITTYGLQKGKPRHLKRFNWEIMVLESRTGDASCYPNGNILITTEALRQFTSDVEIATIIAHEVAHIVARHWGEAVVKHVLLILPRMIFFYLVPIPNIVKKMNDFIWRLKREQEFEADYISLTLMASAGYDPRSAPKTLKKSLRFHPESEDVNATHSQCPPRKERIKRMLQVMEAPLGIYNNCTHRRQDVPAQKKFRKK